jgi:hypothetical protein
MRRVSEFKYFSIYRHCLGMHGIYKLVIFLGDLIFSHVVYHCYSFTRLNICTGINCEESLQDTNLIMIALASHESTSLFCMRFVHPSSMLISCLNTLYRSLIRHATHTHTHTHTHSHTHTHTLTHTHTHTHIYIYIYRYI